MTIAQDTITFAALPVYDPAQAESECLRMGEPTDWLGLCNSFRNPRGREPGRGWVLLTGAQLDTLDINAITHALVFKSGATTITVANLTIVRADAILPGATANKTTLYLVEVADRRQLGRLTWSSGTVTNTRGYNVRSLPAFNQNLVPQTDFVDLTRIDGASPRDLYTWTTMFTRMWDGMNLCTAFGAWSAVDVSGAVFPVSNPENFALDQCMGWESLNHIMEHIGHAIVAKHDGTWKVIRQGIADTTPGITTALATSAGRLLRTRHSRVNKLLEVPESVVVNFPYNAHSYTANVPVTPHAWINQPAFRVKVTAASILGSSITTRAGTFAPIYDSMVALNDRTAVQTASASPFAADTSTNTALLNARAIEIAGGWLRRQCNIYTPEKTHDTFSGLIDLDPSPLVSGIVWYDFGDGIKTDIIYHPGQLDMSRKGIGLLPYNALLLNPLDSPGPPDIARPKPPTDIIAPSNVGRAQLGPWGSTSAQSSLQSVAWNAGTSQMNGFTNGGLTLNALHEGLNQYFVPGQSVLSTYLGDVNKWMAFAGGQIHVGRVTKGWRDWGSGDAWKITVQPLDADDTTANTASTIDIRISTMGNPGATNVFGHPNVIVDDIVFFTRTSMVATAATPQFEYICLSDVLDDPIGTVKMMVLTSSVPRGWAVMDGAANSAANGGSDRDLSLTVIGSDGTDNGSGGFVTPYDPGDIANFTAVGGDNYDPATLDISVLVFIERLDNSDP